MRSPRFEGTSIVKRVANTLFVGGIATIIYSSQTVQIADQDIASLVGKTGKDRWLAHIEAPVGETVALTTASMLGKQPVQLSNAAVPNALKVSREISKGAQPQRINRALKSDRVLQTTARQAPEKFSAGSVLERHSILDMKDNGKPKEALAFLKPKTNQESLQVASVFHTRKEKQIEPKTDHLPVMVAKLVQQSKSSVQAYAPEPAVEYPPFSAVIRDQKPVKIVPKLGKGDHKWAVNPLPKNSWSKRQQECLARGIYFEARGEPAEGQAAVAQVILNRVRNPHYPNSICGVVYQNQHWYNRCQFSFACDRIKDRITEPRLYKLAQHIALETTNNRIWFPQVGSSTHYHATYVAPKWRKKMKRVGRIGLHIFYRTYGGGWS